MQHGQVKPAPETARDPRAHLLARYRTVRERTEALAKHLTPEDMLLQAMPDASPTRWHLAHTSWFFEEFVLQRFEGSFAPYDPHYAYLFNSYYNSVGEQWPRDRRGLLSRPSAADVFAYRAAIDERVEGLLSDLSEGGFAEAAEIITLGLHHEEQHQELLCTDIKAAFALNPLAPAAFAMPEALEEEPEDQGPAANDRWVSFEGGIHAIGHEGEDFAFDNETKRHKVYLDDFSLHGTPVTNGQFLAFIEDGGYRAASLWLAEGWDWRAREAVVHPVYWRKVDGAWFEFTLHGLIPLRPDRILSHVSAYEAFAFAEWAGARLPREAEVEVALSKSDPAAGQFLDPAGFVHPHLVGRDNGLGSAFGTVWDWTQSAYSAYPGFRPAAGAIGEYNGKFMSSQLVLKGGSCATPPGHIRATYRNFFPPDARWQFTGIRLARDV
ncbi:ergothioneine biosynthesis protein EgtB [Parvularcula sp. ZS-1/3]|uniref:Ergothioneine biosynthesis protein EgtB n=1 Tax=Parvularcula mediterranea TaxID=2732508 RepID=A0A7Y3RJD3_9PROT|nr:ergothioneine biosynthesis protein EgtB [Parvularcula mediterranea]NNU14745.1 ergothioneine biosynthesis protein EgtB [Parvularcula mediterranea]